MGRIIYPEECDMSLQEKQALPLKTKLAITRYRIIEWIKYSKSIGKEPVVMFSGGFDSSVLLDIARDIDPTIRGIFANTGIEFPEIYSHVRNTSNITSVRFDKHFSYIIKKYGYPVISKKIAMGVNRYRNTKSEEQKHLRLWGGINPSSKKKQDATISQRWHFLINAPFLISEACCNYSKKNPLKKVSKNCMPIIGTLATESNIRKVEYIKRGCHTLDGPNPQSRPLSFWTPEDIKEYAKQNNVPISEIYLMGYKRTGCVFCMFGIHRDHRDIESGLNRFQLMKQTHPKLWNYGMDKLELRKVMGFLNLPIEPCKRGFFY